MPCSWSLTISLPFSLQQQGDADAPFLEPLVRSLLLGVGTSWLLETAHVALQVGGGVAADKEAQPRWWARAPCLHATRGSSLPHRCSPFPSRVQVCGLASCVPISSLSDLLQLLPSVGQPLFLADHAAAIATFLGFYVIEAAAASTASPVGAAAWGCRPPARLLESPPHSSPLALLSTMCPQAGSLLAAAAALPKKMVPLNHRDVRLHLFKQLILQRRRTSSAAAPGAPAPEAPSASTLLAGRPSGSLQQPLGTPSLPPPTRQPRQAGNIVPLGRGSGLVERARQVRGPPKRATTWRRRGGAALSWQAQHCALTRLIPAVPPAAWRQAGWRQRLCRAPAGAP